MNEALEQKNVCIIGAGPGGLMAAMFLAKKGISSVVLEKSKFPRDKICGDALSGKVVEVLKKLDPELISRLDFLDESLKSWGVTFIAPNKKPLRVPFKQDFNPNDQAPGYISKRVFFDNWMYEEARKYPEIEIREEVQVADFEENAAGWLVKDKQGNPILQSKILIAADGAQSRFARQVGGIEVDPRHYCGGLRAYYDGVEGMDHENFIELHFLEEFLPGYFWIFPLPNGQANVGVGMRSDVISKKKINLKKELVRILEEHPDLKHRFRNATLQGDIKGFGLPLGSKKRPISGSRFMLLGDAASLIDPFTGEGIGNALYSGYFAAEQVEKCLAADNFSAEFMAQYDLAVYDRLWSELKLSSRMQSLVKFPWLFNLVVNKANKNKTLADMISFMFEDLDIRERLKSPMFYLKLFFSNES